MKKIVLKGLICASVLFCVDVRAEAFQITRKLGCELVDGTYELVNRGRVLTDRKIDRLITRLEDKIDSAGNKRKARKHRKKLRKIERCLDLQSEDDEVQPAPAVETGSFTCPSGATKQVNVFSITICATEAVPDSALLHTAKITAEYMDNNEDGSVDDERLNSALAGNRAMLEMYKSQAQLDRNPMRIPDGVISQPHFSNETFPGQMDQGVFDITLEETLHLISSAGLHYAYPSDLGEQPGSRLTLAMDLARGGYFPTLPAEYPAGAWYSYDDETCEYICMASEYFYWALTSLMGGQAIPGRLEEIGHEWRANTPEKVQSMDPAVYALLTDPSLKLPTVLPDGNYTGGSFTIIRR